jgi:hypothetical protein
VRISHEIRQQVRNRATGRCEYCHLPDSATIVHFQVEHIIPIKHHGSSELDNLAWACLQCNAAKGSNLAAYDPDTAELTPLFNPRQQQWVDHFELQDAVIVGKTSTGRVTVDVLNMNISQQIDIREAAMQCGLWA